ncbi:signal peptidase complex-like protein DTM1 [Mercurialis annua]|uniref:signal peptidase complex-like protein DTM1 n=1 Tax=Mercurialis annua TaxID=3986 RepID=UPI00215E6528|nr:signal peptidase complex-like protein DTM1 [Mercurialis annua]
MPWQHHTIIKISLGIQILPLIFISRHIKMANNNNNITTKDAALRTSLVWLAGVMLVVGICTQSFKKVMLTYGVGVVAVAGVLLPDWDYFDRQFSRWSSPITQQDKAALAHTSAFRNSVSPVRLIVYTAVYGYGLYKWWTYITS